MPFVYYDSGYYLLNSKYHSADWLLMWRPLTYSLFLKALLTSLPIWMISLFHNLFIFSGLFALSKTLFPNISMRAFLCYCQILWLTPFPIYTNLLLPDFLTSGLIIFLIIFSLSKNKLLKLSSILMSAACSASHFSNLLITPLYLLVSLFREKKIFFNLKTLIIILLVPIILILSAHWTLSRNFTVTNGVHAFLFSRLMALGVGPKYLDENCQRMQYRLCEHRDKPFHIWQWGPETQIGALGGISSLSQDFNQLNKDILMSHHIIEVFTKSVKNIFKQVYLFSTPPHLSFTDDYVAKEIELYSKKLGSSYKAQKLMPLLSATTLDFLKYLYSISFILSLVFLFLSRFVFRMNKDTKKCIDSLALFFIINSIICGALAEPLSRYNGRIVWIFCFLAILTLGQKYFSKTKETF